MTLTASGQTKQLKVTGHCSDGGTPDITKGAGTTYVSSDPKVATVSTEGLVTAVANGTTTITITNSGYQVKVPIIFSPPPSTLTSIEITPKNITLTKDVPTQQLKVTGTYSDNSTADLTASSKGTTYTSSNPSVARVNAEGIVNAVADGTITITAKNKDKSDNVTVTVYFTPVCPISITVDPI